MTSPPSPRAGYAAAVGFAGIWLVLAGYQCIAMHRQLRFGGDFFVYLIAVGKAWNGKDPYLPHNIGWGFFYPPPALLLVRGLHQLNWFTSYPALLFQAASAIGLVGALAALGASADRWRAFVGILLLTSGGVLETLYIGQINAFVVLALAIAWVSWDRGHHLSAPAAVAGSIVLKATPIFFLAMFCRRGLLPSAAACVAIGALLFGISEWLIPAPHLTASFLETLAWSVSQAPSYKEWNYSLSAHLPGLIRSPALTPATVQVAKLLILGTLLLLGAAAYRRRPEQPASRRALFIASNVATGLAPTIVWLHHATLLLPAVWLLLCEERSRVTRVLTWLALLGFQATRALNAYAPAAPGWTFVSGELLLLVAATRCVIAGWSGSDPPPRSETFSPHSAVVPP